jgi:hypothetical protein
LADFGRGIKAGAAVAAVYLIISVILELTGFSYQFPVITAAGLGISLEPTDPLLLTGSIFGRIVQGVIFGAVFAALYDYLPGTTSVKKALVLSSCLWVLVAVELIYTMISRWPADGGQTAWSAALSVAGVHVSLPSISKVLAGITSALALGALTGLLWDKFRATRLVEAGKGSGVLLVSFALGVWMWLSPIVGVIMYVINQGTIVMEPGPLWWVNILSVVAALIGLPGWVLAFVAWRKTRRGESGFKWGVAGGVMMAVTGLLLIPGVLAIAGGVLSRRKPAIESSTAEIEQ